MIPERAVKSSYCTENRRTWEVVGIVEGNCDVKLIRKMMQNETRQVYWGKLRRLVEWGLSDSKDIAERLPRSDGMELEKFSL